MTTRPKIVDELKSGLEGVTPGPYVFSGVRYKMNGGEWQNMFDGQDRAIIAVSINPRTLEGYKDGCHIARCSPDNISALIEWGEAMEREMAEARSYVAAIQTYVDQLKAEIDHMKEGFFYASNN